MSARDELVEHYAALMFEDWSFYGDWHHALPEDAKEFRSIAAKKVDAVLHEAAERIREYPGTQWWGQGENRDTYEPDISMCHEVADLIDPEATT